MNVTIAGCGGQLLAGLMIQIDWSALHTLSGHTNDARPSYRRPTKTNYKHPLWAEQTKDDARTLPPLNPT